MGDYNKSNGSVFVNDADANLVIEKYAVVMVTAGENKVEVTTVNTDKPLGVLQDGGCAGDCRAVVLDGETTAIAGAAIPPFTEVMADASGHIIPHVAGGYMLGKTLDKGAGQAGDYVLINTENIKVIV